MIKRKSEYSNLKTGIGVGNDKWEGFVYYCIRGGQQDAVDSHIDADISPAQVQLFNPSVEYANEKTSLDITLVLIYFALFSIQLDKRDSNWNDIKLKYQEYFKTRVYNGISLFEYTNTHICLNLEKDILTDPIQVEPIYIDDFTIKNRDENSVDITHQISVKKAIYTYDRINDTILTPAQPTNLFWSKHLSNMMQQDYSLEDYFERQRKIIKKWDTYGIKMKNKKMEN